MRHNSPLFYCGMYLVASFQRVQYGRRVGRNCMMEKPNKCYLSQTIKVNNSSSKSC